MTFVGRAAFFAFATIASAVVATIIFTFATLVLPVLKRTAAPFVCPDDSERSVVVQSIRHSQRGTSFTSDLYCIDHHRGRMRVGDGAEFLGLAAVGAIGGGAGWILIVLVALTAKRRRSWGGR